MRRNEVLIPNTNGGWSRSAGAVGAAISRREYIDVVPKGVEMMLKVSCQIERGTRLTHELSHPRDRRVARSPTEAIAADGSEDPVK